MMKTKIIFLVLILSLVLIPVMSGCETEEVPEDEEGQSITLEFATFWPEGDFQVSDGHQQTWADEIKKRVEEETPHTIDFHWHPAQSLLEMPEIYSGVADGVADIGTTCPSYTPGVFPVTEAFELPGLPNDNALVASMTIQEAYNQSEHVQAEYEDVKVMHFWATGPGDFMTNTRVESAEDLDGLTIRAVGGSIAWAERLGADTVTFGMGDSYENIEQGVVDGLLAPTDTLKGFRLAEVTQYITKSPPAYNMVFMKVMNWDTWNALPEEVQEIIEEVNTQTVEKYGKLRTDHTVAGQEYGVEEHGMEVIELEEDEYQRWLEETEPVLDDYIEKLNEEGLPGEEIMDLAFEIAEDKSEKYGDYDEE